MPAWVSRLCPPQRRARCRRCRFGERGCPTALRGDAGSRAPGHGPPQAPTGGMGYFWRGCTCQQCSRGPEWGRDGDHPARAGAAAGGCRQCQPQVCSGKGQLPCPCLRCHGKRWPARGVGPRAIPLFGSRELTGCRRAAAGGLDCSGAGDTAIGNTLSRQHRPAPHGEPGIARAVPSLSH